MKKILIFLTLIVLTIAILPIIGNSVVEETLNTKLQTLQEHGIDIAKVDTDSTYLLTKTHYEFLLRDADKFLEYLSKYSDKQLPPYTDAMLEGIIIGGDLQYRNFPFSKAVCIDIYPLSLSTGMIDEIKKEDLDFYKYIDSFLQGKGILYHINYNVISKDFDGFLKDINESYTLKDSSEVSLELTDALYHGNGDLIAPTQLISSVEKIVLKIANDELDVDFNLNGFSSSSNFESQSTYLTSSQLDNLEFSISTIDDNLTLRSSKLNFNLSSNTQGPKAQMFAKSSFKDLTLKSKELNLKFSEFNYDISLDDIDKDSLEEFRVLLSKVRNGTQNDAFEEKIRNSLYKVLSYGARLDIADFSFKKIVLNEKENLEGLTLISSLVLHEDKNFAKKMTYFPIAIVQSIDTNIKLKISKKIFAKMLELNQMVSILQEYAKDEGSSVVFEIIFKNGEFRINGKALSL